MNKFRVNDPTHIVPIRVLTLSLILTLSLVIFTYFLEFGYLVQVLSGFWVGVIVNLVNFLLIVIGARKSREKNKISVSSLVGASFLIRFILNAACLILIAHIGLHALFASAIGLSMVGLVLKLSGFSATDTNTWKEK